MRGNKLVQDGVEGRYKAGPATMTSRAFTVVQKVLRWEGWWVAAQGGDHVNGWERELKGGTCHNDRPGRLE